MTEERINFRGMRVLPDWPQRLREAQLQTTCRPNRIEMPRIRYGIEHDDWGANERPRHDCAALKGEYHSLAVAWNGVRPVAASFGSDASANGLMTTSDNVRKRSSNKPLQPTIFAGG